MNKIAVIHFAPLELYPPVQNLIHELDKKESSVSVFSTRSGGHNIPSVEAKHVTIMRFGRSHAQMPPVQRYVGYIQFFIGVTWVLLRHRPSAVMYFETLSSWPAYIYKRFVKRDARMFIHYHEYTTPSEYERGMVLTRYFHKLEKWLYTRAEWISHTNADRLTRFKADIYPTPITSSFVLPNYPPEAWYRAAPSTVSSPLNVVYVGAVNMDTMYVKEFAEWIMKQQGNATWSIYSLNCEEKTERYLVNVAPDLIKMHPGVDYGSLPAVLKKYDVGVILYKGHIMNYVFNAPNKLFEYRACGLAVWFPIDMTGSLPYVTEKTYPEVIALDFNVLKDYSLEKLTNRDALTFQQPVYSAESVLAPLLQNLMSS